MGREEPDIPKINEGGAMGERFRGSIRIHTDGHQGDLGQMKSRHVFFRKGLNKEARVFHPVFKGRSL